MNLDSTQHAESIPRCDPPTDLEPRQQSSRVRLLLAVLAYVTLLVGGVMALLPYTAFPITWDELWYMGLAFSPEPEPRLLNRYGHIYLLHAAMRFCGDPYRGAQVVWCLTVAGSLLAIVLATRPLRLPLRAMVLATTALLMMGQDTFSWSIGVAYVDQTVMLATTVAVALVLPDVIRDRPLGFWKSLALGGVFLFAMRSKDTSIILSILILTVWMQPGRGLWPTWRGFFGISLFLAGMLAGIALFMIPDALLLNDPLFSLRPSNWKILLSFGLGPGSKNDLNWLGWMLRPQNFVAFFMYAGTVVPLAALEKKPRLTIILLIPLLHLLLLVARYWAGADGVVARYSVVFLPLVCFLGAYGAGRLMEESGRSSIARSFILYAGFVLAAAALAIVCVWPPELKVLARPAPTFLSFFTLPAAVFGTLALLLLAQVAHGLKAFLCVLAFGLLMFWAIPPAMTVMHSVRHKETRKFSKARFPDLRELTQDLPLTGQSRILVSGDIYQSQLYNRGVFFARTLISMNARFRLKPWQVEMPREMSGLNPEKLLQADFVLIQPSDISRVTEVIKASDPTREVSIRQTNRPDAAVVLLANSPSRVGSATRPDEPDEVDGGR